MPSEIITLLILLAVLLLIRPRRLSASAAGAHRWLMFSLLSAKTSRSCSAKLLSTKAVPKLYSCRGLSLDDFSFVLVDFQKALASPFL